MFIQQIFADISCTSSVCLCIDTYGGWYKCLFRKCYYPLTHVCQEFSAARMQQNWKAFPPTPSGQTEKMGVLHSLPMVL